MKRSSSVAMSVICLMGALMMAEEPAKNPESVKPQWQRYLQGENAKQAAEQEKQRVQLKEAGKFVEALKVAEALEALREKVQGKDHWQVVNARWQVVELRGVVKQAEETRKQYASVPELMRQASSLENKGRFQEAQPLQEKILAIRRKVLGEEHPSTATSYNNLAYNQNAQSKYQEAEEDYRKALAIERKVLGEEHPQTATSYNNLALNQNAQGKYQKAEECFRKALAICRKVLGEEHPHTATSYNNLANNQNDQGKYKEAEEGYRKALAIKRKVLGEEHPQTAASYNNLSYNQHAQGKYAEAEEGFRKALAICRKVLGEEHPQTAASYNNLSYNQSVQVKYKEAEEGYRKALAIRRKVLGEEHPDTATSYDYLAANQDDQGKYTEAEESHRKALAIRRKVLGEEHPKTVTSYNNLAYNQNAQGKYTEAEEIHRKALAIRRKLLGEEHPDTTASYNNLAANQNAQGKYQEAEESHRKALAIRRKVLGEEHPQTALSYNNLAANQNAQGKYQEAEEGYRKALTINRKVLGEEHPHTATSYNNLANNHNAQGKYQEAETGCHKALGINRKVLGEEHPQTALSYHNLAANQSAQGKYKEAEESNRKALAIRRKVMGEEHPDIATNYNNMAANQNAQGKYKEAEESLRKALAIDRKVLGEEHPKTATSYNNLAANQNAQGKYQEAEEGLRKALAIRRKVLGEEHPDTATSYRSLAHNQNAQGKYQEAEELWRRASDSFAKARLRLAATGLDRATKTSEQSPLPFLTAVLARNGKPDEALQRFEESLARGTWDDLNARLRRSPAEQAKQAQLIAQLDRLDKLIEKAVSIKEPTPEQNKHREQLLSKQRQTQDEMFAFAQQLEKKYGPVAVQVFDRATIQAALPPDSALIGWLDIPGEPKAADPNGEHWAVLLRSSGSPVWVRLSGSDDKQVWTDADTQLPARLRQALQSSRGLWQPLAQHLRQQRLQPLAKHIQGVRHLIVLPSTALAGVPVEVIADGYTVSYAHSGTMHAHLRQQKPLTTEGLFALADPVFDTAAEKNNTQPLPPGGVLLTVVLPGSNAAKAGLRPNDVLLHYNDTPLAGPADFKPLPPSPDPDKTVPVSVWRDGKTRQQPFFVRTGKLGAVLADKPAPQALAEQRRLDHLLRSPGDKGLNRLPGTRVEVAALQRLFGSSSSRVLLDSQSSEQRLNELAQSGELGQYRYVHLATHGEVDNVMPLRSAVILARDQLPDEKQRTNLLLSGQPIPDGRLTAEEVLRRWNLHCELVTLSACQTALGKYERGEGFVGFAQALVLSGSRSVCLSLWKVNDTATALLMERFYQNLLGRREGLDKPMSKASALAEAKAWLRNLSREEAVKRAATLTEGVPRSKPGEKRPASPPLEVAPVGAAKQDRPFAHPYYWAAFVLVGQAD